MSALCIYMNNRGETRMNLSFIVKKWKHIDMYVVLLNRSDSLDPYSIDSHATVSRFDIEN